MSEKPSLPQRVRDWGQVILITCAIGGGALTFTSKAWGWFNSGPAALTKAEKLEKRTLRLEYRSEFMIRAAEKILKEPYDRRGEERMVRRAQEERDEHVGDRE